MQIPATYTEVWDNQFEFTADCAIDEDTHTVTVLDETPLLQAKQELEEELAVKLHAKTGMYATIDGTDCFITNGKCHLPEPDLELGWEY